jgi:hypothetical protein
MREASIPFAGPRGAVGFWMALTHSMWAVLLVVGFVTALSLVYVQAFARLQACDYQCRTLEQEEAQLRARQRGLLAELDAARDTTRVRSRAEALRLVRAPDESVRQVVLDGEAATPVAVAGATTESRAAGVPETQPTATPREVARGTGEGAPRAGKWSGATALPTGL